MASITIRNIDDDVKTRLRVRAADNGRFAGSAGTGGDPMNPPVLAACFRTR